MINSTRIGIFLAVVLISGTLGSTALVFATYDDSHDDSHDNESKKFIKKSLKKICKDKDERKTWHCKVFKQMKGKASELIKQIKKNTVDIKQINESLVPDTLQSCNGTNEVLRFTEGEGWICEKLDISSLECSGHGSIPAGGDICECNEGFGGKQCDQLAAIPAGTTIQQIKPASCDVNGRGWCPDGTTFEFDLETIPSADFDSTIIIKVDGSTFNTCTLEHRSATNMFKLICPKAPSAESIFSYVVLIP